MVFQTFFAPYLFDRRRNNRRDIQTTQQVLAGKDVQKTTFEAAEMMLGPWSQQTSDVVFALVDCYMWIGLFNVGIFSLPVRAMPEDQILPRLRNYNSTDDSNVDFRSFRKILRSRLGKLMYSSWFISSTAVKWWRWIHIPWWIPRYIPDKVKVGSHDPVLVQLSFQIFCVWWKMLAFKQSNFPIQLFRDIFQRNTTILVLRI